MQTRSIGSIALTILYSILIGASLITNLGICGQKPGVIGIAYLISIPLTCVFWGRLYLMIFKVPDYSWITIESCLITGFWLTSLWLSVWAFFSPSNLLIWPALTLWLALPLCFLIYRSKVFDVLSLNLSNFWLLSETVLAMSLWSQTGIIQKIVEPGSVIFLPWSDHFVHASIIQRLYECSRLGIHQEFALMSGVSLPPYHYGSYMFAVVVRSLTDISSINISTAFWLPLGAILSSLGAFALGNGLWGNKAGIACAFAISFLPDPYMYGCGLGYFSYHFLGQTGAALYYAEAIAAIGLSLIGQGIGKGDRNLVACGFFPILTLFMFKVHVFVIILPVAFLWFVLFFQGFATIKRALGICFVVILALAMILVGINLKYFSSTAPWVLEFFRGIFSGASPNDFKIYSWVFGLTQRTGNLWDDLLAGTILLWFATLGPLLIAGIFLAVHLGVKKRLDFTDTLPFLCIATWTMLVLFIPSNEYGNLDEFHHRPFHVAYYIFVIWLAGRFGSLLFTTDLQKPRALDRSAYKKHQVLSLSQRHVQDAPGNSKLLLRAFSKKAALVTVTLGLVMIPWHFGKNVLNIGPCARRHQNFVIDIGLWESADFIRRNSRLGEIFLDSRQDGFLNLITAVSERRPFLSSPYHKFVSKFGSGQSLVDLRKIAHEELKNCTTAHCIHKIASSYDLRWYLAHPGDLLSWPDDVLNQPAFASNGYMVFDLLGGDSKSTPPE
ncbi:MAG: hypothetical protein ACP5U1_12730 [Desulfomonilaceae bacterium]